MPSSMVRSIGSEWARSVPASAVGWSVSRLGFLVTIAIAVAIIMIAKATISTAPGSWPPMSPPAKAPTMPAAPKMSPVRHRTRRCRACTTRLDNEVTPTISSEAAMASFGGMPAM